MKFYAKIFPIKDGYKHAEATINEYLRKKEKLKITSISQLGEHHIIIAFEKGDEDKTIHETPAAAWIYKEDYMNNPVVQCPFCGFITVGINKYCAECGKRLKE